MVPGWTAEVLFSTTDTMADRLKRLSRNSFGRGQPVDSVAAALQAKEPNGLINSATEDLLWDYDGDDIVVTLTRDYLRPNESVTLRWEIDRDQATA